MPCAGVFTLPVLTNASKGGRGHYLRSHVSELQSAPQVPRENQLACLLHVLPCDGPSVRSDKLNGVFQTLFRILNKVKISMF